MLESVVYKQNKCEKEKNIVLFTPAVHFLGILCE